MQVGYALVVRLTSVAEAWHSLSRAFFIILSCQNLGHEILNFVSEIFFVHHIEARN